MHSCTNILQLVIVTLRVQSHTLIVKAQVGSVNVNMEYLAEPVRNVLLDSTSTAMKDVKVSRKKVTKKPQNKHRILWLCKHITVGCR